MWNEFEALVTDTNLAFADFTCKDKMKMAAATLLVHAALADDEFHESESDKLRALVHERFCYDDTVIDNLLINAGLSSEYQGYVDIEGFIQTVRDNFNDAELRDFLRMIWDVIIADGKIHPYEQTMANMLAARFCIGPLEHEEIKNNALQENPLALA